MATSLDPSVDELLLLQENQYPIPNLVFANIKPIGAERKIGQPSNATIQSIVPTKPSSLQRFIDPIDMDYFTSSDIDETSNCLNSLTTSIYDQLHFSSMNESGNNELDAFPYHRFSNHSISSGSSTSGNSSTTHSPRSSSYFIDNHNYQRQPSIAQPRFSPSIPTQMQTGKTMTSFRTQQMCPTSQFFIPNSSQTHSRNPFLNIYQQSQPFQPIFTAPMQCTRERFQVNSIGRPILRANNYTRLLQATSFKARR
ncbi:unnamed protein product [Rotaria magnacalcarata]|uniref:Uncharacterized protein n=1 Tax=Rotaria magnacalcarata TaxID=392030 RepID=A0A815LNK9_9BILA|nr:unnamed protein product [Rotaria magnacalcarata]CAF1661084.1 unnamed protein product [Rotaria magnacalcarata]CAF2085047.1 unnamed protein product [Rotaria magnacalcarata]CAF4068018.1 unnamed protein product [Rotaria magnacalcarata]CAF4128803.1 unnamed protein product [Rotaria magnacalcarata]